MSKQKATILEQGRISPPSDSIFGYYGWPTVARLEDGTLLVGASGPRVDHICPFGATALFQSRDNGTTWTSPMIVNNSPLDDRDVGLLALGGQRVLLSWFTLDIKYSLGFLPALSDRLASHAYDMCRAMASSYTDELNVRESGSFARLSGDGGITWGQKIRLPVVMAAHGPSIMRDGSLLVMGKETEKKEADGRIMVYRSKDEGHTWSYVTDPPLPQGDMNFYEPHLIQLRSGRVLAHLRHHVKQAGNTRLDMYQTCSDDGGETWSMARPLEGCGSPPHLLEHSSGALICVYGRREPPFGESYMISWDGGENWLADQPLDWGAPSEDLGYPSSVELEDGSLFTVYYQKAAQHEPCALLYSHWRLPEQKEREGV